MMNGKFREICASYRMEGIEDLEKTGDPNRRRVLYSDLRVRILNIV